MLNIEKRFKDRFKKVGGRETVLTPCGPLLAVSRKSIRHYYYIYMKKYKVHPAIYCMSSNEVARIGLAISKIYTIKEVLGHW